MRTHHMHSRPFSGPNNTYSNQYLDSQHRANICTNPKGLYHPLNTLDFGGLNGCHWFDRTPNSASPTHRPRTSPESDAPVMAGTCTPPQKNKLKKSSGPPTTSSHFSDAAGPSGARLIKPGRALHERRQVAESRTMALARQQIVEDMVEKGSSQQDSQGLRQSPHAWEVSRWRRKAQNNTTEHSDLVNGGPDSSKSTPRATTIAPQKPPKHRSVIGRYLGYPVHAVAESVTAIEHYWALRAMHAEVLLTAHTAHRQELSVLEDRRTRDLTELNAKYLQEYAKHARMVWISMGSVLALLFALLSFVYRQCVPAASSRWPGPLHFTIPILSPFASVIEHETSVVNVQLVALLLLGVGGFAFLWFRCAPQRR